MAKISSADIILPNGKKFKKVIKYTPKKGYNNAFFSIDIPEEVAVLIGKHKVTAFTEEIVDSLFKDALQDYKNAAKKTEKKIIIKLKAEVEVEQKHFQHGQDYNLAFNWGVYEKSTIGDKYKYEFIEIGHPVLGNYYLNSIEERRNSDDMKVIPWTETRQSWCESLEAALLKMLCNIEKFMNDNDDSSFAARLDQGNIKLLSNGD